MVEVALAVLLFGMRDRRQLSVVALAQVVTNPSVVLVCLWSGWRASLPLADAAWRVMLAAELAAVAVEALLYRVAEVGEHPWRQSLVLNALSFGVGLLLA